MVNPLIAASSGIASTQTVVSMSKPIIPSRLSQLGGMSKVFSVSQFSALWTTRDGGYEWIDLFELNAPLKVEAEEEPDEVMSVRRRDLLGRPHATEREDGEWDERRHGNGCQHSLRLDLWRTT